LPASALLATPKESRKKQSFGIALLYAKKENSDSYYTFLAIDTLERVVAILIQD
jgi:hypothetical protein